MLTGVQIAKPFIKATVDILITMAGIKATPGVPYIKKSSIAKGDVSAIVGVSGDLTGTIAVSFTKPCAVAVLKSMLGDDIHDLLSDLQDVVGELTNMISGQARAGLVASGLTLQGTTPTVVVGDNHILRHISASPVIAIPFTSPVGEFTVEFCFACN